MRRRSILVLLVLAAALVAAGAAQARLPQSARELRAARLEHRTLPPRTQLRLANHTIHVGASTLTFLKQHPHAGTRRGRQIIAHNHSWLIRFGAREKRVALAHLAAEHAAAALPAHYRGWLCITHGSSFNDTGSHEGNGYNGRYTGPLGMSTPWMGRYPPGSDWVHSDPAAVYRIAEEVTATQGFSYSFMAGQWPQTFPPCAGYF